jgi:hypothetical protein
LFCLFLDPKVRLGSSFCENNRTFIGFLTQTINNYELDLTYSEQSIVLEKRFNALQVKRIKNDCKITIESKSFGRNAGIYVNILKMKMRQYRGPGIKQNECIDSITIKYNDNVKKRFCGDLENNEIKSLEDHKGKVKITISIDKQMPFSDPEDYVEFQIVATVFKGKLLIYFINLISPFNDIEIFFFADFQIAIISTMKLLARRM